MRTRTQILLRLTSSQVPWFWRTGRGLPTADMDLLFTSRASIRIPSFRAEQTEAFSALPLLRKFGLRSEKSLFVRGMSLALYALLLAFAASAQAPEPMPLAHANVPGEPHHHLKIENEYVRVYYVEVPPHESTQLHQHDHDYLFVSLGPADVINAVRDKPEIHLQLKDGETHFTRGGFAHIARNLSDASFRNITIELLKPQEKPENLCAEILFGGGTNFCGKTLATSGGGHGFIVEPQMETAAAYLNMVRLEPETKGAASAVPAKSLVVALNDAEVQIDLKGGVTRILHGAEMAWIEAGGNAANPSNKPSSYLQITVKAASPNSKP